MRHGKKRLQMNRFTSWNKATNISMARNLLRYQQIKTTKTKALAARPLVEKLISLAKDNTLAAKRKAFQILSDHNMVSMLFSDIGPRFSNKTSGFVRILNLSVRRRGDSAQMVIFELTDIKKKEIVKKVKKVEEKIPAAQEPVVEEEKHRTEDAVKEEKHPKEGKSQKKFLGGIRNIFKKERDSL